LSSESPTPPPIAEAYPEERTFRRAGEVPVVAASEIRISVGDGFKFGCGFLLAVAIALLVGILALSVGFLLASLLGIPLPVAGT
jgi:hypothetical protein